MDADTERVTNYLSALMAETELLARSCGYTSPEQLHPNDVLMQVEPGHGLPAADVITSD
jgi:glutamate synthase domain-containing protein 2